MASLATGTGAPPDQRLGVRRVLCEPVAFAGDAVDALLSLRELPEPFALTGRWAGGGALVGASPRSVVDTGAECLAALDALGGAGAGDDVPPGAVGGGWFGWLGYRVGGEVENLPSGPPRPVPLPGGRLAFHDHLLRMAPDGCWWVEGLARPGEEADVRARMRLLSERLQAPPSGPRRLELGDFVVAAPGHAGHRWAVAQAVERIAAGDLFQVNLGVRVQTAGPVDPVDLFARTERATRPAYGAVFTWEGGGIVSLSPELFLRRCGREVHTGPIKGTVRREPGAAGAAARAALEASGKDAAEHVMIVDLMRNDLGRVCEFGSVTREERRRVEAHPGVWHLVSDVAGRLRPEVGDGDLVRATFPPGSVTGAPKVQSLKLISELEGTGRELFTGAIGYASPASGLELSVAIRTFELAESRVWLGVGGGIVADSDPDAELAEALAKAAPLVAAAGARIEPEARPGAALRRTPRRLPRATELAPRPDPAHGLLETIRVQGGAPVALDAHLARLAGAVAHVLGAGLPALLRDDALSVAGGLARGRLRIHVVPEARDVRVRVEAIPDAAGGLPGGPPPLQLTPFVLPGGLGAFKWRDRRLVDALAAATGAVPLLVDADGAVLEAGWANVFLERDGIHFTPPADGRLLPGVGRALRLRELRSTGRAVCEEPLTLDDLAAGEVVLTSALRTVQARLRS